MLVFLEYKGLPVGKAERNMLKSCRSARLLEVWASISRIVDGES
jgi:hypothetical protein